MLLVLVSEYKRNLSFCRSQWIGVCGPRDDKHKTFLRVLPPQIKVSIGGAEVFSLFKQPNLVCGGGWEGGGRQLLLPSYFKRGSRSWLTGRAWHQTRCQETRALALQPLKETMQFLAHAKHNSLMNHAVSFCKLGRSWFSSLLSTLRCRSREQHKTTDHELKTPFISDISWWDYQKLCKLSWKTYWPWLWIIPSLAPCYLSWVQHPLSIPICSLSSHTLASTRGKYPKWVESKVRRKSLIYFSEIYFNPFISSVPVWWHL